MKTELFVPYRNPNAILRVENKTENSDVGLELVTHEHSPVMMEESTFASPSMLRHSLDQELRGGKEILESVEIRVEFDKPEHVLRSQFVMWNSFELDFPMCHGNGRVGWQVDPLTHEKNAVKCVGPAKCPLARQSGNLCMVDARLGATINEIPIEVRTNSENGFIALLSGLRYVRAKSEGKLSAAKMSVVPWKKSTRGSSYVPFTTVSIEYVSHDSCGQPVSESMRNYGEQLLKEWESQFKVLDEQHLQMPHLFAPANQSQKQEKNVDQVASPMLAFPFQV